MSTGKNLCCIVNGNYQMCLFCNENYKLCDLHREEPPEDDLHFTSEGKCRKRFQQERRK